MLMALAGGAAGFALIYAINAIYKLWRGYDGLGFGDVKLMMCFGVWLGPHTVCCRYCLPHRLPARFSVFWRYYRPKGAARKYRSNSHLDVFLHRQHLFGCFSRQRPYAAFNYPPILHQLCSKALYNQTTRKRFVFQEVEK